MTKLEQIARQALETLEIIVEIDQFQGGEWETAAHATITALRDALAEQAECPHGVDDGACKECYMEQAEQEPVAVVEITYGREPECYVTGNIDDFPEGVFKLYAAPVQTKDLTNSEKLYILGSHIDPITKDVMGLSLIDAVIAADREKNK